MTKFALPTTASSLAIGQGEEERPPGRYRSIGSEIGQRVLNPLLPLRLPSGLASPLSPPLRLEPLGPLPSPHLAAPHPAFVGDASRGPNPLSDLSVSATCFT